MSTNTVIVMVLLAGVVGLIVGVIVGREMPAGESIQGKQSAIDNRQSKIS